jgi:hypothetical protein
MTYYHDERFDDPRKMIDFFIQDDWFRTSTKYDANRTGKGGMIFRGQSDAKWDMLSSAFRKGSLKNFTPQPPDDKFDPASSRRYLGHHLHAEGRAVYIFMESADSMGIPTPLDYTTTKHGLELILAALNDREDYDYNQPFPSAEFQRATALAQHHGVPTRFLDWTESPLVACYFAAIGASSFSKQGPSEDQELSVAFLSTFTLSDASSPVELIKAPRHGSSNLRQQQGVFTNIKYANSFLLEHGRWPAMDDFSSAAFQLHRVRFPAALADDLLKELFDLKITRHSMMPSLTNAASAYEYARVLFDTVA